MSKTKKICFIVNNAAFFVSHRLNLAIAAIKKGHSVTIVHGNAGNEKMELSAFEVLERHKINFRSFPLKGSSTNLINEFISLFRLFLVIKEIKPDLVHCISPKGVLYGGLIARLINVKSLVLSISGMGYIFTATKSDRLAKKALRRIFKLIISFILKHENKTVIVQNSEDFKEFEELCKDEEVVLIPGSGVDLSKYKHVDLRTKEKKIVLAGRMLVDKGIYEFYTAAKALKKKYQDWEFILMGAAGYDNPSSISADEIRSWEKSGCIDWYDYEQDISKTLIKSSIVCLPSYREGMPKILLEAAASGCAVVTSNATGCIESVIPNKTANISKIGCSDSLTEALEDLILNKSKRLNYSNEAIKLAHEKFDIRIVTSRIIKIYHKLLQF